MLFLISSHTDTSYSECYCAVQLSPEATKLSGDNCTSPCPGSPRLSCGGNDAFAIYSLASASQTSSTDSSSKENPPSSAPPRSTTATTRPPPISESLVSAPVKAPGIGMGALSPPPAPTSSHMVFEGQKNSGGGGPPAPASTTTVAAISGSMSGAILLGALLFFCFRAYKKRRLEQDARIAAMVVARKTGRKVDDDDDSKKIHYERSPSRGRRRTRDYQHRPPSLVIGGDVTHKDKDVRLTTDGSLVPTTPALESGGRDPASYYHTTSTLVGEHQKHQSQRDSLFSALLGQVSVPIGPHTPPAIGSSSAVQWRRTADIAAAAAAHSVPVSPLTKAPDHVAVPSGGLGERAWHRRRISTPYAPPPTVPLPPTPPNKKRIAAAAAAAAAAIGGPGERGAEGPDRQPPQRPPRRESAATFEAAPRSLGATSSMPDNYPDKTLEYDGDDEEGGMKPVPPLKTRTSQQPPPRSAAATSNGSHETMGGMVYLDHHAGRQPTIPSLPPITPGEQFDFDSRYWKSLVGGGAGVRRNTDGEDDRSPASATTVGTSILMESPTLPWETDPIRRTAEHEKRQ